MNSRLRKLRGSSTKQGRNQFELQRPGGCIEVSNSGGKRISHAIAHVQPVSADNIVMATVKTSIVLYGICQCALKGIVPKLGR